MKVTNPTGSKHMLFAFTVLVHNENTLQAHICEFGIWDAKWQNHHNMFFLFVFGGKTNVF